MTTKHDYMAALWAIENEGVSPEISEEDYQKLECAIIHALKVAHAMMQEPSLDDCYFEIHKLAEQMQKRFNASRGACGQALTDYDSYEYWLMLASFQYIRDKMLEGVE